MEPNATLAGYSNLALYSAMVVYALAMVLYAVYLAALSAGSSRTAGATVARASERVKVPALAGRGSGASSVEETTGRTGDGTGSDAGDGDGIRSDTGSDMASDTAGDAGESSDGATALRARKEPGGDRDGGRDGAATSLRARKTGSIATSLTWLAGLVLLCSIVLRGLSVMRPPWGNMFEFACAGACVATFAYLALARRMHWEWLGLFVTLPVLLTLGLALRAFYTAAAELMPALQSVWLVIHVTVAILAVGVFTVACAMGVLYLLRDRRERAGAEDRPVRRSFLDALPRAHRLERYSYTLNMIGFILWTFTLVAGAIWAQKAWGSYWTWDPKEVWTFVVWVVYAAYMHARATAGWEPRKATWIAIAGFVSIVLNFAVVNVYFVGQHSYSGL